MNQPPDKKIIVPADPISGPGRESSCQAGRQVGDDRASPLTETPTLAAELVIVLMPEQTSGRAGGRAKVTGTRGRASPLADTLTQSARLSIGRAPYQTSRGARDRAQVTGTPSDIFLTALYFKAADIDRSLHRFNTWLDESWANDSARLAAYEVVLGPMAIWILLGLPDPGDRKELAGALRTGLINGPNAHNEYTFDSDVRAYVDRGAGPGKAVYTATPLSLAGYTAVHRPLTKEELRRLRREQGRSTATRGLYVIDILAAESAFTRITPRRI